MIMDPWLPTAFILPDESKTRSGKFAGTGWQIMSLHDGGHCLLTTESLFSRWCSVGFVEEGAFGSINFGSKIIRFATSEAGHVLCPVVDAPLVRSKSEALSFSLALKETRRYGDDFGLQDSIYFEKISRLLPTYTISFKTPDELVLGFWLTGGANIPATSIRRLDQIIARLSASQIREIVLAAGIPLTEAIPNVADKNKTEKSPTTTKISSQTQFLGGEFDLPGRPGIAKFFNEHIIDIIKHQDRYRALGIEFPSSIILYGPPGCGKTFAVERLVDFLDWPCFQVDSSSIASPYIHETSRKISEMFQNAIDNAPSVLVIDEMEAFLADRDMGMGHHRVEEVAEFLRLIPEASSKCVLLIAMTNRIDMIDPAIQRRGRFDHIIKVDFASEMEILMLLESLLDPLPKSSEVCIKPLARKLKGKPLSDVSFVVREAARLTAKSGQVEIDQNKLLDALKSTTERECESGEQKRKIGFI